MSTALSVNLNAIAYLRNRRSLPWPDVEAMGRIALGAGAQGLTVHPRPDARHIRASDLPGLSAMVGEFDGAEFNIEGFPSSWFCSICDRFRPAQITLVPDDPLQRTSDHGWDIRAHADFLLEAINALKPTGARISLFVEGDGDVQAMEIAAELGADRIELYTGPYGAAFDDPAAEDRALDRLKQTAETARTRGLGVNAGHDLTLGNLPALISRIPFLSEVSIGQELVADALIHGMSKTVQRFRTVCGQHLQAT